MWSLLYGSKKDCLRFLERLEEAARDTHGAVAPEALLTLLPLEQREHATSCENCRSAARDLLAARTMLNTFPAASVAPDAWFAPRVMAAIAAQEREGETGNSIWAAVPRLASRLAGIAAVLLLFTSAWLLQKPANAPARQPATQAAWEGLFDTSPNAANQDDVLVSVLERDE